MLPFSQSELKSILSYDPETGIFTRARRMGRANKGDIAGSIKKTGYREISVRDRRYLASRLAWFYMTGQWPVALIDHKNRNRADDRWSNLREATRSQNQANRSSRKNSSGVIGVTWHAKVGKWQAQICHNKKNYYLGVFEQLDAAKAAYAKASIQFFGEFARAAT